MTKVAISRRMAFGTGAGVLAAAAGASAIGSAQADTGVSPQVEAIIRKHYNAWVEKDWKTEDSLLADDFTFSSAAPDDHISKAAFKKQCWDTQASHIKGFDLVRLYGSGDEAFVLYNCLTMDDKTFQNVEYLKLRDGKIASIYCYFGAPSNYPTEVSARQK